MNLEPSLMWVYKHHMSCLSELSFFSLSSLIYSFMLLSTCCTLAQWISVIGRVITFHLYVGFQCSYGWNRTEMQCKYWRKTNKQKSNRSTTPVGNISEICWVFFLFWLKWWLFWKNIFINPNEQRDKTALRLSALEWKGEFCIEKMKQDVKMSHMKLVF